MTIFFLSGYFGLKCHNLKTRRESLLRISLVSAVIQTFICIFWGRSRKSANLMKDKEILVSTYKAVGQSVLNYCAPVLTPSLSKASWDELQPCQNAALRAALGCVKMTSIDHLHAESNIMPVKAHNEMLAKQFLLSTQNPTTQTVLI